MTSEVISEPDGPRFGPYILTAVLGRGGMGVVYRAFDTVKGRTVALKVLIPELAADRAFQDRFRRESKRAARLSEPHIIPIHDYGQIDGRLFIDMRLVEGTDLATLLDRDGPMPPPAAAWIMAQVAAALDAAHAGGLVHRDVKPSNVLITGQGKSMPFAYLIDFGIARLISSASMSTSSTVGTVAYMAPERFTGSPGDRHADVYSLACVLFECLTGRPPFSGEMVAVMWAQLNAVPPAPSTLRPGLPPAVDEVVARGLAKDPARRYGSAGELAEAILAATADLGAVSVPVPGADQAHDQRNPPTVQDSVPVGGSVPVSGSVPVGGSGPARSDIDVPLWDSDPDGRARTALRAIVSDPARGVAALSSMQAMSTALKELLPGKPRETKVLVAAAEEGLAEALSYHVAHGMDPATVRDKVARSFARHTGFRPAACQWAVDELAAVLGLDSAGVRPVT
jgi:serine/threonine protein kinase